VNLAKQLMKQSPSYTVTSHQCQYKDRELVLTQIKRQAASTNKGFKFGDGKQTARFEVITVVLLSFHVFWNVTLGCSASGSLHFETLAPLSCRNCSYLNGKF
jgi:hypothetical protein